MSWNILRAEYAPQDNKDCDHCLQKITYRTTRIIISHNQNKECFHLRCYEPKFKRGIHKDHIYLDLSGIELEVFNYWLEKWNSKYPPIDESNIKPTDMLMSAKSNQDTIHQIETLPINIDVWVEIFKYLTPHDIARSVSIVSKELHKIAWNDDLWHFYCENEYGYCEKITTWRDKYLALVLQTCFGCRNIIGLDEFFRCSHINKPICSNCQAYNEDFKIINKKEVRKLYDINPNIIHVKWWIGKYGERFCYRGMIEKGIIECRKDNKVRLLGMFLSHKRSYNQLKEIVNSVNVEKIDFEPKNLKDFKNNPFEEQYYKILDYIKNRDVSIQSIKPVYQLEYS